MNYMIRLSKKFSSIAGSKLRYLVIIFLSLGLVQCGSPGEEDKFTITLTSSSPLVVETPRTYNGTTIAPNWFPMSFSVNNEMKYGLRVEEVSVYVTVDGIESGPHSFD